MTKNPGQAQIAAVLSSFSDAVAEKVRVGQPPRDAGELISILASAGERAALPDAAGVTEGSERLLIGHAPRVHRRIPSGHQSPRTQHAGDLVNDLLRLAHEPGRPEMLAAIYFTDDEMAGYLDNRDNGLHRLFDLPEGHEYVLRQSFLNDRPKSFTSRLRGDVCDIHVVGLVRRDCGAGFHLRVWRVLPDNDGTTSVLEKGQATSTSESAGPSPGLDSSQMANSVPAGVPEDWHDLFESATRIPIKPERSRDGSIRRLQPQPAYAKRDEVALNRYGTGSFCRFKVPTSIHQAGVYMITANDRLAYVGECQDFSQRFNAGYGQISPKNCYEGGQETNCRINQRILACAESGWPVEVVFIESTDRHALESACIAAYAPPWNRTA